MKQLLIFLLLAGRCLADPLEFFNPANCVPFSLNNTPAWPDNYCRTVPQWYLKNTGEPSQVFKNGVPGASEPGGSYDLNIPANARADGIIVGVIDSGCRVDHPDLANTILGGCYINDRGGSVLIEGLYADFDPQGHGTGIASIIAANRNGAGMAGVAQGAKLLIVSTPLSFPEFSPGHVAKGINWLVNHGARVIVLSWGEADAPNAELFAACQYANSRNVVIVSAVGYSRNLNTSPTWPYAYNLPNYVSVSAITRTGAMFPNSSYGSRVVGAPGDRIVMASIGDDWVYDNGTSFASPMAGAVIALQMANRPQSFKPSRFIEALKYSARQHPVPNMIGRIDATAALSEF